MVSLEPPRLIMPQFALLKLYTVLPSHLPSVIHLPPISLLVWSNIVSEALALVGCIAVPKRRQTTINIRCVSTQKDQDLTDAASDMSYLKTMAQKTGLSDINKSNNQPMSINMHGTKRLLKAILPSSDRGSDLLRFRDKADVGIGRVDTEGTTLHTTACPSTAITRQPLDSDLLSIDFTYDKRTQFRCTDVRR